VSAQRNPAEVFFDFYLPTYFFSHRRRALSPSDVLLRGDDGHCDASMYIRMSAEFIIGVGRASSCLLIQGGPKRKPLRNYK